MGERCIGRESRAARNPGGMSLSGPHPALASHSQESYSVAIPGTADP